MRTRTDETTAQPTTQLTTTEGAVLGLLAVGGPASGYDLHRRAQAGVAYIWAPAKSRVYAALPRLLEAGYVSRRSVVQSHAPDKGVHRITPAGEQALRAWLERAEPHDTDRFLLRVFFGRLLAPERLAAHVADYRSHVRSQLAEYEEIERRIRDDPDERFGYLTLRWGLAAARARLRWAEEALRELEGER